MKALLCLVAAVCITAQACAAEPLAAARASFEKAEDLANQLFLYDAESTYASGDFAAARAKFGWLAARGVPQARLMLGIMFEEGQGVLQDYGNAVEWYAKAARQGFAPAQVRLARMYFFGRHVRQDNLLAYVWASLAASQGDEDGRRNLSKIGELMSKEQVSSARALADEWSEKFNGIRR
jgi:TPR repeat protein